MPLVPNVSVNAVEGLPLASVEPVAVPGRGRGVAFGVAACLGGMEMSQAAPVQVVLASEGLPGQSTGYRSVEATAEGFVGTAEVAVGGQVRLHVSDSWSVCGSRLSVVREVRVAGRADDAFMTALSMARTKAARWGDVKPFAPGAIYGDSQPVPRLSIGSPQARRMGTRYVLCREDRLAAPLFALRYDDDKWVSVGHEGTDASTTVADRGPVEGGETLVDERFGFASLGGTSTGGRLYLGAFFPGTEGPHTYSTGEVPLKQYRRWRYRFHPLKDGLRQHYRLSYDWGHARTNLEFFKASWRRAWDAWAPVAAPVAPDDVVTTCTAVLARQVRSKGRLWGVPLEVDAVTGVARDGSPAIMGFVGANTDAGYVLVRMRDRIGGREGESLAALGAGVIDSFCTLKLGPPQAEGFDLATGRPRTYRTTGGQPAVYARSLVDGCSGALKAWEFEASAGRSHAHWLHWARSGADWLLASQADDGSFPRAWRARSGRVLESSTTASHIPVAFLARLGAATGEPAYLASAIRAGEYSWRRGGRDGCFAGATLDNPDVVDKEAAVYALEGYLALHAATGEGEWLQRAVTAATLAETWIYVWDVAMPVDAKASELHWLPGVATVGEQLIATGVSTCDGFLAANAAAFAELYKLTLDQHFLDVARLVTHGTKAMLSLPGRRMGLRGPGWQQEHWCLAIPRGLGLTRDWLPWVAVANVEGILRLEDLGGHLAKLVLFPPGTP